MLFILLLVALTVPEPALNIDIGKHGSEVIMQEDIESIVITKKLQPLLTEMKWARKEIGTIRKITMNSMRNKISSAATAQQRLATLNAIETSLSAMHERLGEYQMKGGSTTSSKEKRALEFLGDFLSTVTGVPSARAHRLVVEQIKAVRSENKGIERLLGQQNAENAKILRRLHFHEDSFNQLATDARDMNMSIFENKNEIAKVEALLSLKTKADLIATKANTQIRDLELILQSSDAERLSRSSISISDISKYLKKIYRDRESGESPLFTEKNIDFYYQEKLSHSWIDENNFALITLLQIPIAQMGKTFHVNTLPPSETVHSGLPLCLVDSKSQTFRFLGQSDYIACRDIDRSVICQKRKIEIFDQSCPSITECKPWKHTLVHDLTNSKIMFILPNATTATLDCTNKRPRSVEIPTRTIASLDIHCSLRADSFNIGKLTFRHMMDVTATATPNGIEFNSEKDLLSSDPNYEISKLAIRTNESLESLIADNSMFNISLNDFIEKSDRQWTTLNPGAYPLEQILLWSACALNLILALILAINLIKLHIAVAKAGTKGDREDDQRRILSLTNRIMELETQYQIQNTTIKTSTPTMEAPPFNF
jgi:hypothetical protein